jgi:hypothetical protein
VARLLIAPLSRGPAPIARADQQDIGDQRRVALLQALLFNTLTTRVGGKPLRKRFRSPTQEAIVTTAPIERSRRPWAGTTHARPERPRPPRGVAIAAGILYVYAMINFLFALAGLAVIGMDVVNGDDSQRLLLSFVAAAAAVYGFYVLLAAKTRQGRRWAWITTLILLSFFALLGLGAMAVGLTDGGLTEGGAPPLAGLILVVPTSLFILLLAGPRSSREYFRR